MYEDNSETLRVALARIEGKVDTIMAQISTRVTATEDGLKDHETRLRAVEQRPVLSPKHVYAAAGLLFGAISAVATIIR